MSKMTKMTSKKVATMMKNPSMTRKKKTLSKKSPRQQWRRPVTVTSTPDRLEMENFTLMKSVILELL